MSSNEVRALHSPSQKAWANARLRDALPRLCLLSLAEGKPGELFILLMLRFLGGEMEARTQAGAQVPPSSCSFLRQGPSISSGTVPVFCFFLFL